MWGKPWVRCPLTNCRDVGLTGKHSQLGTRVTTGARGRLGRAQHVLQFRQAAQFAVRPRVDALRRVATYGSDREIGLYRDVGSRRARLTDWFGRPLVSSPWQVGE
jgi:hypothetical protein